MSQTTKHIVYCVVDLDGRDDGSNIWAIEHSRQDANAWRTRRLETTPNTRLAVRRAKLFLYDT